MLFERSARGVLRWAVPSMMVAAALSNDVNSCGPDNGLGQPVTVTALQTAEPSLMRGPRTGLLMKQNRIEAGTSRGLCLQKKRAVAGAWAAPRWPKPPLWAACPGWLV